LAHAGAMFAVTEADAAAIRTAFHEEGELSAAIELRRRFPGVTDNAKARACARTIECGPAGPDRDALAAEFRRARLASLCRRIECW
jgi:hypothetical protein